MKISELIIDPKSFGNKFWLTDVTPAYQYVNGQRTDNITGYRYNVALPERSLEKVNIKIDGEKLLDKPEGYAEVTFTGLEVFIYWSNGQHQVGAKATGITLANRKT